jgi:hypothetical protein
VYQIQKMQANTKIKKEGLRPVSSDFKDCFKQPKMDLQSEKGWASYSIAFLHIVSSTLGKLCF